MFSKGITDGMVSRLIYFPSKVAGSNLMCHVTNFFLLYNVVGSIPGDLIMINFPFVRDTRFVSVLNIFTFTAHHCLPRDGYGAIACTIIKWKCANA